MSIMFVEANAVRTERNTTTATIAVGSSNIMIREGERGELQLTIKNSDQ
jgi:hypothetical protein